MTKNKNENASTLKDADVSENVVSEPRQKGEFVISIETPDGPRFTGPGTDWLVKTQDKAQIYKTRAGCERWVEKSAKAQGDCVILDVTPDLA